MTRHKQDLEELKCILRVSAKAAKRAQINPVADTWEQRLRDALAVDASGERP